VRKLINPNPSWKHGYKFLAYNQNEDIAIGIRNGKEMTSLFMTPEDALELAKQLIAAAKGEG
jgi:hypothetical protein